MDSAYDSILRRRSIRKYTSQSVSDELINRLLTAGMSAPSACNQQPWHFIVINDQSILKKLTSISSAYSMLDNAAVAMLICGEPETTVLRHFWEQDCSAATENILLAAQAHGLGGVWLGVHPDEKLVNPIRDILKVPEHIQPFAMVSLGYPAEERPFVNRFKEDRVHYNIFQKKM